MSLSLLRDFERPPGGPRSSEPSLPPSTCFSHRRRGERGRNVRSVVQFTRGRKESRSDSVPVEA